MHFLDLQQLDRWLNGRLFINLQVIYQPTSYLSICKCSVRAFSERSDWLPAQQFSQQLRSQFTVARSVVVFVLGQKEIATADDEDYAHFFVCLCMSDSGSLKERKPLQSSCISTTHDCVRPRCSRCVQRCSSSILATLNGEANDNGTLATVISIVHHGRSRLYTSVMVAMVIYHTSCPAGPRYDNLGV